MTARGAAGLVFVTWAGLVVMLVGAFTTPANWCSAGGQSPEGHQLMAAGVSVVVVACLAGLVARVTKSRHLWLGLRLSGVALVGVLLYASLVSAGWGSSCP